MTADKRVFVIAGPNGAGKTTFATEFLPNEADCPIFVNADLIAAGLSPFRSSLVAVQAARLMLRQIEEHAQHGRSFAFETTLSGRGHARRIPRWREQGYRVKLFFLGLPTPEAAIARVRQLRDDGRLVIVFANKSPDAWETLVSALIRAGFVVDGSWPIQTERLARTRAMQSAALASSIWIVCRKRPAARAGWDTAVLAEMRANITQQLRDFWVAGIRGPDFVWAATGPALEAFSKYPVVKKADAAGSQMTVSEFLREVRRFVVDFVVGRVLTHDGDAEATSGLDDVTTYYLLHRNERRRVRRR